MAWLFVVFLSAHAFAQDAQFQSLVRSYESAHDDASRIQVRSQLAELYKTTDDADIKGLIHDFLIQNPYPKSGLAPVAAATTSRAR